MGAGSDLLGVLDRLQQQIERLQEHNERLQRENVQFAGHLGFLQGQLDAAQERIKLLESPPTARRPWWQFWR